MLTFSEFCSATRKHGLKHLNPTWTAKLHPCFVFKDVVVVFQSQGAITEKLRSFSMHDLTSIQGDEPVGQRACQPLPEAKKKTRASASESSGKYLFFIAKRTIHQTHKWENRNTFTPLRKNSSALEHSWLEQNMTAEKYSLNYFLLAATNSVVVLYSLLLPLPISNDNSLPK